MVPVFVVVTWYMETKPSDSDLRIWLDADWLGIELDPLD
jgi:hypothetical protein